jgi:DNA-binding winged helix-turn-helix (wHTH) protein
MAERASVSVLVFDGFRLDRQAGGLFRIDQRGRPIPLALGCRGLDLLDFLARRGGEPVSKDEIMTVVWSGRAVEEANLNVQISKLRHILDQDRAHGSCIQTITGFGYRFVAEVTFLDRSTLAWFHPSAKSVIPSVIDPRAADCSSMPAGEGGSDASRDDKVVRLALPGRLPRPAENEVSGAPATRGAEGRSFLINRLGAVGVIDPDLAAVLGELQQQLIEDYGDGAAARTLIDQVIAAYQDFIRLTGWIAHLSLTVEHELFGDGGCTERIADAVHLNDTWMDEPGADQHLVRLRECLLPLVERRGALMREMLAALEIFRDRPNNKIAGVLEPTRAVLDQLSRRPRGVLTLGEIGGAQAREDDWCC